MLKVMIALLPAILTSLLFLNIGVIIQLLLAMSTAVICEAMILKLRNRALKPALSDLSAIVTSALLALSLPVLAPWWIAVNGTIFAIVIAIFYQGINLYHRWPEDDKEMRTLILGMILSLSTYFIHGLLNNYLDTDKAAVPIWSK